MSQVEIQKSKGNSYIGALYGLTVWSVYAIVECFFSVIVPWLTKSSFDYAPLHRGFTLMVSILYPLIGLVLGTVTGFGLTVAEKRFPLLKSMNFPVVVSGAATIILIIIFDVNLIMQYGTNELSVLLLLIISFLSITGISAGMRSVVWSERIGFITNPWTVIALLIGLMWLMKDILFSYSTAAKIGCIAGYTAFILLVSFVVQKMAFSSGRTYREHAGQTPSNKYLAFLVTALVCLVGSSFLLNQTPHQKDVQSVVSRTDSGRPNVILIVMDTVRADHMSIYNYERDTTPNMREFIKNATFYPRSVSSGDMTLSSHASIFTGLYVSEHGAHYDPWNNAPGGKPLDKKMDTLAEILSKDGYETMGVVSNYGFVSHAFNMDQGFQYFDQRVPVVFLGQSQPYYIRQGIRDVLTHFSSPSEFDLQYRRAEDINREAFTQLDRVKGDKRPFFLFINYMDAHAPYIPPPPFDTMYPGKDEDFTAAKFFDLEEGVMKLERDITDHEHNHIVSQYDGGISYLDFQTNTFLDRLRKLGLYENSIIIVTSDHGESFGERNFIDHGVSVYQDQVYVPLIIKYPNQSSGRIVNTVVNSVDILPTILSVSGINLPQHISGKSLVNIESAEPRTVMSETYPNGFLLDWNPRFDRIERAIFNRNFKFIESTKGKKELYDLSLDQDEKQNLYSDENSIAAELEVKLKDWLDEVMVESETSEELSKDAIDRLKALGYIK